ncbi:PH domain-containing protein [Caerostris extrusa]|uniref:PH domain-containing protein n=1 Tax=Caerostris extrusa TaxID=172846 RepID=A0AAV4M688_CAEEX|nr:PH domain-containing protein [Caerostris extrusa]
MTVLSISSVSNRVSALMWFRKLASEGFGVYFGTSPSLRITPQRKAKGARNLAVLSTLTTMTYAKKTVPKTKRTPYVFIIGTSVRGFFDNRHQFAAESADDMQSWIQAIRGAIAEARVSRRKPSRKRHLEGKSPDLSTSSQESEGTSTACLVNATKDRARGPQGRRLPNRKSMMPASRSVEEADIRQRSGPREGGFRQPEEQFGVRPPPAKEEIAPQKPHKKVGNLMGQHAALTKELEMRLKAGRTPVHRRPPSESEEDEVQGTGKLDQLASKVSSTSESLAALEERVGALTRRVDAGRERSEKQVGDILLQVTVTQQEAERINAECKRALVDANKAKAEYQLLVKECKEMLAKLNSDSDSQQNCVV